MQQNPKSNYPKNKIPNLKSQIYTKKLIGGGEIVDKGMGLQRRCKDKGMMEWG